MGTHEEPRHDPAHVEALQGILMAEDPRARFAASEWAACELCRDELEGSLALMESLDAAGSRERAAVEHARATTGPEDAALVARALGEEPPSTARPWPRAWSISLAAAALLLVGLWVTRPFGSATDVVPGPVDPGPRMGSSDQELLHPVGEVEQYAPFRWSAEGQAGGWFQVHVFDPDDVAALSPLASSDRIEGQLWEPSAEVTPDWPNRIRWELESFDATGVSRARWLGYAARSSR